MLSAAKPGESLAGKLLLSSALVAVSLAYGFWQRHHVPAPAIAMAPATPKTFPPARGEKIAQAPAASMAPEASAKPDTAVAPRASRQAAASVSPKPAALAMATPPQTNTPAATPPATSAPENVAPSPPSTPLSVQASLEMYAPTDQASPPLPLVTGTPPSGLAPSLPPGTHLLDGDYLSDKHQFEWGDLVVKLSIHGGQITAAQILQYPDHRSQSLYLSQMAGPILESEVIKTQQSQVDAVSSATDTSYAFQDAIANIIVKATRG